MHQQIRAVPAKSPPDLEALLQVLYDEGVNLVSAGGSDLELGGEFAFSVSDEQHDQTLRALERAGYATRVVDLDVCWMKPKAGELLRCVRGATALMARSGSVIRDIAIGEPNADGLIPVQISSQEIKGRQASTKA